MNWPAVVSSIVGGVVSLAGLLIGYRAARGQREQAYALAHDRNEHERALARERHRHERDLARRERLYEDVRNAYNHALAAMERLLHRVWLVYARYEEPLPPREELLRFQTYMPPETRAGVSTFGTDDVIAALNAAQDAAVVFFERAWANAERGVGPDELLAEPERERFVAAATTFADSVRSELHEREHELRGDSAAGGDRLDA